MHLLNDLQEALLEIEFLGKQLQSDPQATDFKILEQLFKWAQDPEPKIVRYAIRALGKGDDPQIEDFLLLLWKENPAIEEKRLLVEALGKCGSVASLPLLSDLLNHDDQRIQKLAEQALFRVQAKQSRQSHHAILENMPLSSTFSKPWPVVFRCREGLETLLLEEGKALSLGTEPNIIEKGRVQVLWQGNLSDLFASRLFLDFALIVPLLNKESLISAFTQTLSQPSVVQLFTLLQLGPIRYRIHFLSGGHRRELVKNMVQALSAVCPSFVNDPKESDWEFQINETLNQIEIVPKSLIDSRFFYRQKTVPAASHPTVAAALAWVLQPQPTDIIWDPFVGSAGELIEIALRYPYQTLYGSDLDSQALQAAWENTQAAQIPIQLAQLDALQKAPPSVNVIITNPPMGKRVYSKDIDWFLQNFLRHAYQSLPQKGRLVWISPNPETHRDFAKNLGFSLCYHQLVDMNGFLGEIQSFQK